MNKRFRRNRHNRYILRANHGKLARMSCNPMISKWRITYLSAALTVGALLCHLGPDLAEAVQKTNESYETSPWCSHGRTGFISAGVLRDNDGDN